MEREYLRSMAETTSRALERARLREAERREHARVEALAELTRLLAAALTPEAIGEVVADRVRAAVGGADALCLGVISQDGRRLVWITTAGYAGGALRAVLGPADGRPRGRDRCRPDRPPGDHPDARRV